MNLRKSSTSKSPGKGVVYMLKISQKDLVTQEVMKNLLSAHKRIAVSGEVSDLIRISKYLLRLSEKREEMIIVDEKTETANKYSLKIEVDYADVDTAIEKVNRLVELLREASSIIDSLSAGKNLEA